MSDMTGGSWSISSIPLQEGNNVITVTAKDAANNTATATITVTSTGGTAGTGGGGLAGNAIVRSRAS